MCEIVANLYYAKIAKKLHASIRKKNTKCITIHSTQITQCTKKFSSTTNKYLEKNEYSSLKARILCCWRFKDEFLTPNVIDKVFVNNEN